MDNVTKQLLTDVLNLRWMEFLKKIITEARMLENYEMSYENIELSVNFKLNVDHLNINDVSHYAKDILKFNHCTSASEFDFSIPEFNVDIGQTRAELDIGGFKLALEINGRIYLRNVKISGAIGFFMREKQMYITCDELKIIPDVVKSDMCVILCGVDVSEKINDFIRNKAVIDLITVYLQKILQYTLNGIEITKKSRGKKSKKLNQMTLYLD